MVHIHIISGSLGPELLQSSRENVELRCIIIRIVLKVQRENICLEESKGAQHLNGMWNLNWLWKSEQELAKPREDEKENPKGK